MSFGLRNRDPLGRRDGHDGHGYVRGASLRGGECAGDFDSSWRVLQKGTPVMQSRIVA
jgi:hypothetical protein